jgi:hypothetical protein
MDVPLMLAADGEPGGWWRYRVPESDGTRLRDWAMRDLNPERYVAGPTGFGRSGSLRTVSHISELAERPHGLRAMTEQELARWIRVTEFQAESEGRRDVEPGYWRDRYDRANKERQRRAREPDS